VVNEALNDNGTRQEDVFFNTLGEDYIRIAFEAAAAADPLAKLYYNDFGIETAGVKSTAAQNIVKKLKAAGTKIDGVGLQSHFIVGSTPSKTSQISNLRSFTGLGVEVAITELDVRIELPVTTSNLAQQSTDYQTTIDACLAVEGCVGITVWDFDDKYSWVPSTFPGFGAADLFDANLTHKAAYFGIVTALQSSGNTSLGNGSTSGTSSSNTSSIIINKTSPSTAHANPANPATQTLTSGNGKARLGNGAWLIVFSFFIIALTIISSWPESSC